MSIIHAIYEGGVFRPLDPVPLPEHCQVTFDPIRVEAEAELVEDVDDDMKAIYEILGRSYDTGETDLAARHNEHQP